jgi:hypothetical protein
MNLNYMKAHVEGIALFKKNPVLGRQVMKEILKLDNEAVVNDAY